MGFVTVEAECRPISGAAVSSCGHSRVFFETMIHRIKNCTPRIPALTVCMTAKTNGVVIPVYLIYSSIRAGYGIS